MQAMVHIHWSLPETYQGHASIKWETAVMFPQVPNFKYHLERISTVSPLDTLRNTASPAQPFSGALHCKLLKFLLPSCRLEAEHQLVLVQRQPAEIMITSGGHSFSKGCAKQAFHWLAPQCLRCCTVCPQTILRWFRTNQFTRRFMTISFLFLKLSKHNFTPKHVRVE